MLNTENLFHVSHQRKSIFPLLSSAVLYLVAMIVINDYHASFMRLMNKDPIINLRNIVLAGFNYNFNIDLVSQTKVTITS